MNFKTRPELYHDNEFILATIKSRYLAYLIDWFIISLIYLCVNYLLGLFNINISKVNVRGIFDVELEMHDAQPIVIALVKILFGLLPISYFTLSFYFWKGQTIGKHLLRIRVLSLYHEHIGVWHCIERSLGYYASVLEFGFGFIQAFWNPNRMALHDKIGGTIVIKLEKKQVSIQQVIMTQTQDAASE
jgi:uncharacterized RDD family membrane protein YckC